MNPLLTIIAIAGTIAICIAAFGFSELRRYEIERASVKSGDRA